ncbi:MAG: hypothetical protein P8I93_01450 [Crocinitomicaceae bacterium]|nr:hypothetical protein [Crocinitomicaceae bacterium]
MSKNPLSCKILLRIILIIPWIIYPQIGKSQDLLKNQADTISNKYRVTGELDSVDAFSPYAMSSFPGIKINAHSEGILSLFNYTGSDFFIQKRAMPIYYTSLPHLGFAYTFGAQGFQGMKVNYYQAFRKNWLLNININRGQANGLLRNSEWRKQSLNLLLKKEENIYSGLLQFEFSKHLINNNGGVINISDANLFSPEILSTYKTNAYQEKRLLYLKQENYFNFRKDSLKKMGLFSRHVLELNNRKFYENDTLYGIYNNIYFDSASTTDDLQQSLLSNTFGFYSKGKNLFFTIAPSINIWSYHIANMYRDTVEAYLNNSFKYKSQSFDIEQYASFNLVGANKGWENNIQLNYTKNLLRLKLSWHSESKLPELYKRHYQANNYYYSPDTLNMQQRNQIDCKFSFKWNKQKLNIGASYISIKNPYLFYNNSWSSDLFSKLNLFQTKIKLDLSYKFISASPYYVFNLMPNGLEFAPMHFIGSRISFKGGVFKAKKLILYGGCEPIYLSKFRRMAYVPSISTISFYNPGEMNNGYIDLRVFAGFELDSFRFFARAENLAYLWTENTTEIMHNFPIPTVQIRFGITWDFWN